MLNIKCEGSALGPRFCGAKAGLISPPLAGPLFAFTQALCEWRDREHRRELRHADQQAAEMHGFSGGTE